MLILVHVFLALLSVASATPPAPDFTACAAHATDIVVTDPEGVVLESWRGELRPGEVVRLGVGLTPANALPWDGLRLRPNRAVSGFHAYHAYRLHQGSFSDTGEEVSDGSWLPVVPFWSNVRGDTGTALRLVLFLRKEGPAGAGAVWMPAATPPSPPRFDVGWRYSGADRDSAYRDWVARRQLPHDASADFTTSIAFAEAGRVVAWQGGRWTPLALSADDFRVEALARPAPYVKPVRWADPPPPKSVIGSPAASLLGGTR